MTDVIGSGASPQIHCKPGYWTCGGGLRRVASRLAPAITGGCFGLPGKRRGGVPGRCSRRSGSSSTGREPVCVCRTSGGDPHRHGVRADSAEKMAGVSLRILCRGQKLFREGRLWPNSRRHGRRHRPAGPHELKPTILDLHSASMPRVRGPGKRRILLRGRGFQTPEATVGRIGRDLKKHRRLPPRPANRPAARSHAERW